MRKLLAALAATLVCGCQTAYVSPNGNDAGNCTQQVPCKTLARAYAVAQTGDVIDLADGIYLAPQALPAGTKSLTVVGGPNVKLRELDNSASNVTFTGVNVDANGAGTAGFENHGSPGATNVTFKDASIGNVTDDKGALVSGTDFTFDNVDFHDVYVTDSSVHNECAFVINVPGFTVKNSTFTNCATMDLFFNYGSWWPEPHDPGYGNVTITGNHFDPPHAVGSQLLGYPLVAGHLDDADTPGYTCPGASDLLRGKLNNWTVKDNYIAAYGGGSGDGTLYLANTCPARQGPNWVYTGNTGPGA